jgi:hypothetical protein
MNHGLHEFRKLEGQHVLVDLADGSSFGDCMLVSAGRARTATLWLFKEPQRLGRVATGSAEGPGGGRLAAHRSVTGPTRQSTQSTG